MSAEALVLLETLGSVETLSQSASKQAERLEKSCTCLSSPACQNILEQMVQTEMEIVPDLISILARTGHAHCLNPERLHRKREPRLLHGPEGLLPEWRAAEGRGRGVEAIPRPS